MPVSYHEGAVVARELRLQAWPVFASIDNLDVSIRRAICIGTYELAAVTYALKCA